MLFVLSQHTLKLWFVDQELLQLLNDTKSILLIDLCGGGDMVSHSIHLHLFFCLFPLQILHLHKSLVARLVQPMKVKMLMTRSLCWSLLCDSHFEKSRPPFDPPPFPFHPLSLGKSLLAISTKQLGNGSISFKHQLSTHPNKSGCRSAIRQNTSPERAESRPAVVIRPGPTTVHEPAHRAQAKYLLVVVKFDWFASCCVRVRATSLFDTWHHVLFST